MARPRASILVAEPDSETARDLGATELAGAVTWWRLSGTASLTTIKASLPPGYPLPEPSPETAMRRALESLCQANERVEPIAGRKGLCLVKRTFDPTGMPEFRTLCSVRSTDDGFELRATPSMEESILGRFDQELDTLHPSDFGSLFSRMVHLCHATPLRDTGGIYFVPAVGLADWRALAVAIASSTQHQVYELPAVRTDQAVAAVIEALTREVSAATAEVMQELPSLGERALHNREDRVRGLLAKLAVYETQLGVGLDALREQVGSTQASVNAARLLALSAEKGS